MIIAVIILAILLLAVLEKFWAPWSLKALRFIGSTDHILVQPDQNVLFRSEVENHSVMPILFARLWITFPAQVRIHAEQAWLNSHLSESFQQWHIEERMTLMPRQRVVRSVLISFENRGSYHVGDYRLSAGDLLGISETTKFGDGTEIVVMPRRSEDPGVLVALGGFLGDISVRRFILEDPILTVGFRDYTGREPMKAISWTRTAMTGTMQVKQFDHTAEQTICVLLNVEGGSEADLEECFRLTRTVCEELERKKMSYSFRTNGNLPGPVGKVFHVADGLGQSHLSTILYGLGKADTTCFQSLGYLVTQTLHHRKNNEAYIVITPEPDDRSIAWINKLCEAVGSGACVLVGKEGEDRHE